MSDPIEELRHQLKTAQHALAEAQARCARHDARHLASVRELEHARQEIERAHQEWVDALDAVNDPIFLHDQEFRILRCNKAYQQRAGLPYQQIIGQPYYEIFPKTSAPLPCCLRAPEQAVEVTEEITFGDATYRSRTYAIHDKQGDYLYSVHILEDVTASKRAESSLLDNEQKFRQLFTEIPIPLGVADKDGVVTYFNRKFTAVFGYTTADIPTLDDWWLKAYPDEDYRRWVLENWGAAVARAVAAGTNIESDEYRVTCKNGEERIVVIGGQPVDGGVLATFSDVTERKQHEIAMQRANRALRTISAGNQTLIHATEERGLLQEMCRIAVQVGGYRMAWIGYARDDADQTIEPMAQAGFEPGDPNLSQLDWQNGAHQSCLPDSAILSRATRVVQNIQTAPETAPWRKHASQHGYASCIALPLLDGPRAFGVLMLFDSKIEVFDADEVKLLEEMVGDLAFGILTLRIKAAHREHEQRLQQNMLQTVVAISRIVEMRDPYTSGHQARVAELAKAIALRMGLPEEQIQAIHLAGLVHDLGKIRIPAEILSKPGRLDEIEYSLIKMHPQAGYDILKDVDFSWPIAQMVWQHHERMDGSGYPQGLKGEKILPGARILSVADVVEAISSHRPYRPGLGVEAAVEEISRGRGVHYDPQVVDACLSMLREPGYVLPA